MSHKSGKKELEHNSSVSSERFSTSLVLTVGRGVTFSWSRLGGQLLQRLVFAWKPTEVSLAERTLSLSSLVVILCRKVHQEQLEESEMVPQYWSWVLDHLVAANRMSRLSQEKGVEDLKGWMHKISTSSSGITYSGSICCS